MTNSIEIHAETRSDFGKGASRRLRRLGDKVPGIIYGEGKEPRALAFEHNKIMQATENKAFYSTVLTLNLSGKKEPVIVKALQRHPSERRILHIDLQRVGENKIIVHIPIRIINAEKSPGANLAGTAKQMMRVVKVKCLAKHLPDILEADAKDIQLGQTLHLSDLKLPGGVELIADIHDRNQNLAMFRMVAPKGVKAK